MCCVPWDPGPVTLLWPLAHNDSAELCLSRFTLDEWPFIPWSLLPPTSLTPTCSFEFYGQPPIFHSTNNLAFGQCTRQCTSIEIIISGTEYQIFKSSCQPVQNLHKTTTKTKPLKDKYGLFQLSHAGMGVHPHFQAPIESQSDLLLWSMQA